MTKRISKTKQAELVGNVKRASALTAVGLSETATVADVVKLFKQTAGDVEKSTREGMRKLAELAGLLTEHYPSRRKAYGFGLTQGEVADLLGKSQPWVSGILRWRRDGYKSVAFGPETRGAPKLLAANKSKPQPEKAPTTETAGDPEEMAACAAGVEEPPPALDGETFETNDDGYFTVAAIAKMFPNSEQGLSELKAAVEAAYQRWVPEMGPDDLDKAQDYLAEVRGRLFDAEHEPLDERVAEREAAR